jgi:phosphopentomutase
MVDDLNRQKYTCEAMEPTCVLLLDKLKTMQVVSTGKLQDVFEKRIQFLMQIDLFREFDMHVLLPLAFNLEVS